MVDKTENPLPGLLNAIAFAARAHHGQIRKDGETPYVSHAFRVSMIARNVFGIDEPTVLTAAVLHDTLEDTTIDYDDIEEHFGAEIAEWVAALSKDSRLPYKRREQLYCETLAGAPWQVQACKLADIYDNLIDSTHLAGDARLDAVRKKKQYLDAIGSNLKPEAKQAWELTTRLYADIESSLT